jgi:hypothetical protein
VLSLENEINFINELGFQSAVGPKIGRERLLRLYRAALDLPTRDNPDMVLRLIRYVDKLLAQFDRRKA